MLKSCFLTSVVLGLQSLYSLFKLHTVILLHNLTMKFYQCSFNLGIIPYSGKFYKVKAYSNVIIITLSLNVINYHITKNDKKLKI